MCDFLARVSTKSDFEIFFFLYLSFTFFFIYLLCDPLFFGSMVAKTKTHSSLTKDYIKTVVDKPQVFFSADLELVDQSIALTKHLYDIGKPSSAAPSWPLFC